MRKKAGFLLSFFLFGALLAVERDVDGRAAADHRLILHALRRPRRLVRRMMLTRRDLLRLVGHALMAAQRIGNAGGREAEGKHQAHRQQHKKQHQRNDLAQASQQHSGKSPGDHAAGGQRQAGLPQHLQYRRNAGKLRLPADDVCQRTHAHRQRQCAAQRQGDGTSAVEHQNVTCQRQRGQCGIISAAGQSAQQLRDLVDHRRALLKIAYPNAQRQQQADPPADLAADGALFRLCFAFACRRALFGCFLLSCHKSNPYPFGGKR